MCVCFQNVLVSYYQHKGIQLCSWENNQTRPSGLLVANVDYSSLNNYIIAVMVPLLAQISRLKAIAVFEQYCSFKGVSHSKTIISKRKMQCPHGLFTVVGYLNNGLSKTTL